MSAGNTEENNNVNSNITANDSISSDNTHSSHSSHSSSHSSHSHSSHSHSHSSHSSHSNRSSESSRSRSSKSGEDMSTEYSKRKKIKMWGRSIFISIILIGLLGLMVLIFDSEEDDIDNWNKTLSATGGVNIEDLQNEINELKTENMNLKYELDKYKKEFGELEEK